jgi:cytochrome c553
MKKLAITMLLAGSTLLMADGAATYAKCVGCHGANGEKSALGKSAIIKGQDAAKTIEQLKGYKAGTLNQHGMGGLMKGQVASMSDEDIKAVAEYIASKK